MTMENASEQPELPAEEVTEQQARPTKGRRRTLRADILAGLIVGAMVIASNDELPTMTVSYFPGHGS